MGFISTKLFPLLGLILIVGYFTTTLPYLSDGQKYNAYSPLDSTIIDDSEYAPVSGSDCGILGCTVDNFFNGIARMMVLLINSIGMILGSLLGIATVFQIIPSGFGIVLALITLAIIIGLVKLIWSGE